MDKGLATLLQDLSDRGLLDSTIVWCCGEFGRTPEGRTGSRPGTAGAATTARSSRPWSPAAASRAARWSAPPTPRAKNVKDRPVYPGDLIGSIYELLGIDPEANLPHPMNEIVKATPSPDEGLKLAGRLKEIM